jgi:hypothetical protein
VRTFQIRGGDLVVGQDGRPVFLTGKPKLTQDLVENLVVGKTTEGYGAGLGDMIGSVQGSVPHLLMLNIFSAIEYYQSLQSLQPNVPPSERLIQLINLYSQRAATSNKTDYQFVVVIQDGQDPKPTSICLLYRPTLTQ